MQDKPNLLIVYNYNRYDFLNYFHTCSSDFNFYFAEFVSAKEEQNDTYKAFGKSVYWGNYTDVFHLLDSIKPSKVLFHYINSYFHVILNAACKERGIPTFIIDHGLRDVNINVRLKDYLTPTTKQSFSNRFIHIASTIIPRIKARRYLIASLKVLSHQYRQELSAFIHGRTLNPDSALRVPSGFITISKNTFNYYKQYYNLPEESNSYNIGIPAFDKLANTKPGNINKKEILFIDQGLAHAGVFGWTHQTYHRFLSSFIELCADQGYHLYFKPHPRQQTISSILKSRDNITLVNDRDIKQLISSISIVIGFTSTYLLPLIAQTHITVLTLENHPAGKLDVSRSFIDAGVAHPVYEIEELQNILPSIEKLHLQQLPNKARFTEEWMYKFDGKSGERLRDILMSNKL